MLHRLITVAFATLIVCVPLVSRCEESEQIQESLQSRADVDFQEQSLRDALAELARLYSVNVVIDERALTEAGVTVESPVTLTARQVRLSSVLELLLEPLNLTYELEDEVVKITNPQRLAGELVTRVYSVSDLLQLRRTTATDDERLEEAEAALQRLAEVITGTVDPDGWSMRGGPGYLQPHPGTQGLVIRQTAAMHEQIAKLLSEMRAERFATVSSSIYLLDVPAETCARLGLAATDDVAIVDAEDRAEWQKRLGAFSGPDDPLPPMTFTLPRGGVVGARAEIEAAIYNVMFSSTVARDHRSTRIRIALTDSLQVDEVFAAVQTATVPDGGMVVFVVAHSEMTNRTPAALRICVVAPKIVVQEEEEELLGIPVP
jgi:hypothetical protein